MQALQIAVMLAILVCSLFLCFYALVFQSDSLLRSILMVLQLVVVWQWIFLCMECNGISWQEVMAELLAVAVVVLA